MLVYLLIFSTTLTPTWRILSILDCACLRLSCVPGSWLPAHKAISLQRHVAQGGDEKQPTWWSHRSLPSVLWSLPWGLWGHNQEGWLIYRVLPRNILCKTLRQNNFQYNNSSPHRISGYPWGVKQPLNIFLPFPKNPASRESTDSLVTLRMAMFSLAITE